LQICTRCNTSSPDAAPYCLNCQVDLREWSVAAKALKAIEANPRARLVRVAVSADACPICRETYGAYKKGETPALPVEGCSSHQGCRCFYEPVLDDLYP
jgi:hypothetical protein